MSIADLPIEILLSILILLVPTTLRHWFELADLRTFPIVLADIIEPIRTIRNVCRLWREVVDACPSLAVPLCIVLDDKGVPEYDVRVLTSLIESQRTLPLVAAVISSQASSTPITARQAAHAVRLINEHCYRLERLALSLGALDLSMQFPAIYAPNLIQLSICQSNFPTHSYGYPHAMEDREHAIAFLNAIDAPKLQRLSASVQSPDRRLPEEPLLTPTYTSLTRLEIATESLGQLATALNALPGIVHLTTSVYVVHDLTVPSDGSGAHSMPPVHLARLDTLKIQAAPEPLQGVLSMVRRSTQLRRLYLRLLDDYGGWLDSGWAQIVESWPELRTLALANFVVAPETLLNLSRAMPMLAELALEGGWRWGARAGLPVDPAFLYALTGPTPMLPNLVRLSLYGSTWTAPPLQLSDAISTRMRHPPASVSNLLEFRITPRCCQQHINHARYADEQALQALSEAGLNVRFARSRWMFQGATGECAACLEEARDISMSSSASNTWGWPGANGGWEGGWEGDWEGVHDGGWGGPDGWDV